MRGFTEVTLGVGTKLCNEGETAKYAYLLNSGECQIIRNIRKPVTERINNFQMRQKSQQGSRESAFGRLQIQIKGPGMWVADDILCKAFGTPQNYSAVVIKRVTAFKIRYQELWKLQNTIKDNIIDQSRRQQAFMSQRTSNVRKTLREVNRITNLKVEDMGLQRVELQTRDGLERSVKMKVQV